MPEPIYATAVDLASMSMLKASELTSVGASKQAAALSERSRWADSFLRSRYKLPLIAWGDDLKGAIVKAADYDLACQLGYNPQAGADVNYRLRFEDAERWLKMVSLGEVTPDLTDSSPGAEPGSARRPRVYSSTQRGYSSRGSTDGDGGPFTGD